MASRQIEWAHRAKEHLRLSLGYKCAVCGKVTKHLQFDCIIPRGHKHHRMEFSWRISFYRKEHKNGNLQLLCPVHHQIKSATEHP